MPNKWTFQIPFINGYLRGSCLNKKSLFPFAGKTRIYVPGEQTYIDIDPKMYPDIVGDAVIELDLLVTNGLKYDVIVLDPPFTMLQAHRTYKNNKLVEMTHIKNICVNLIENEGTIITFGFNSTGMSKSRGFKKEELHIFNHGGYHNDTLMLVESKIPTLDMYIDLPV